MVEMKHIQEITRIRGVIAKGFSISGIILTTLYALAQSPKQML